MFVCMGKKDRLDGLESVSLSGDAYRRMLDQLENYDNLVKGLDELPSHTLVVVDRSRDTGNGYYVRNVGFTATNEFISQVEQRYEQDILRLKKVVAYYEMEVKKLNDLLINIPSVVEKKKGLMQRLKDWFHG